MKILSRPELSIDILSYFKPHKLFFRIETLERQCTMITDEKETSLKQSKSQAENSILSLKHEMSLQQTKTADKISTLQEQLTKLQHTLEETIAAHKLQLMVIVVNECQFNICFVGS